MKKKQAHSKEVKCDICGQLVFARGLKNHVRLLHKLKVTEITKITNSTPVVTQVMTQVKPKSAKKVKAPIIKHSEDLTQVMTQVEKPTQVVTQVVSEVTTQVIEKQRIYTSIHNKKIAPMLTGISMPSISRWKSGSLTEIELKEINRVAKILNKSVELYMSDLEKALPQMPEEIREQFK